MSVSDLAFDEKWLEEYLSTLPAEQRRESRSASSVRVSNFACFDQASRS